MLVVALRYRQRKESLAWVAGLTLFALYYGIHVSRVLSLTQADAGTALDATVWLQMGGLSFLIACTQMNGLWLLVPQYVSAVYMCHVVLGAVAWRGEFGLRLKATLFGFLALFWVVGQPINQYWGLLLAPPMCLALARSISALRGLWRAAGYAADVHCAENLPLR